MLPVNCVGCPPHHHPKLVVYLKKYSKASVLLSPGPFWSIISWVYQSFELFFWMTSQNSFDLPVLFGSTFVLFFWWVLKDNKKGDHHV